MQSRLALLATLALTLCACRESAPAARTMASPPSGPAAAATPSATTQPQPQSQPRLPALGGAPGDAGSLTRTCRGVRDHTRDLTSPDGRVTVFVMVDRTRTVNTTVDDAPHEDLCVTRDGGSVELLVEGRGTPEDPPDKILAQFSGLVFSRDGATLFFTSAGWVTSPAAHAVELTTRAERFLFDGSVLGPVAKGADQDKFVAWHFRLDEQHPIDSPRYRGRISSWSLVTRDGKTVRKLQQADAERLLGRPIDP